MEPGYASPIGAHDTTVVVDELAARSPNLVAGANRHGFHLRNVNVGRDFTPDLVADIVNAREGDACPNCGEPVHLAKGIEVGNIFKLGTDFTEKLGATYLAEDGSRHHVVMGSYGIGLGRAMACIVEAHHDEKGIAWPEAVAPYAVHLVALGAGKDPAVAEAADGALPAPDRCRPGGAVRRPRRVGRREADRRRDAGHAHHRDHLATLPCRGRRGGHQARDRGALGAARSPTSRTRSAPTPEHGGHEPMPRDPNIPDAFDVYTLVLLRRPPDAPEMPDAELDALQARHLAYRSEPAPPGRAGRQRAAG